MARKSRKNAEAAVPQIISQPVFRTGAYVRLSAVDRKQKGDSIETQQAIIGAYIDERPDLELTETYIDDGLTGQNTDRPAFQRMLADLEAGKINCCITKDLSRLGRNSIDTGFYIEKYFPTHGIRYIAINDNYDSADGNSGGIMVSLKNLVNEAYALDIGRKIRATKQMNIRNGCFVGQTPPYGYMKSPENRHKLIPDEYAASIVRRIFEMAADGEGVTAIVKWLNGSEIPTPRHYYHTLGLVTANQATGHKHWQKGAIYQILHNRVYMGDMVQGKGKTNQYTLTRLPASEWIITPDAHEGIVSRELFAEVQKLWEGKKKAPRRASTTENIFLRKIYCGHCGYTMKRLQTGKSSYTFSCDTRQRHGKDDCVQVSINETTLRNAVLNALQGKAGAFSDDMALSVPPVSTDGSADLRNAQAELDRNTHFLKGLYESLVSGVINDSEFRDLKSLYEEKIASLTEAVRQLREAARLQALENEKRDKAADTIQTALSISDLTAGVLGKLIEKILVYEDKRVEIHYKFTEEVTVIGEGAA